MCKTGVFLRPVFQLEVPRLGWGEKLGVMVVLAPGTHCSSLRWIGVGSWRGALVRGVGEEAGEEADALHGGIRPTSQP